PPLAGKRILVTRARHQAGQLSIELKKLGAEPIEVPAIEIVPPESFAALDAALQNAGQFDWLIVTSANAARAIRERCDNLDIAPANLSHLKIAAIGAPTAHALGEAGLSVAITPSQYVAESLLEALGRQAANARVLIVRAAVARDVIPESLARQGAHVTIADAYRTAIPQDSIAKIAQLFTGPPPDAATFTSSSTVSNFSALMREAGFNHPPDRMLAISIGPITSQTLRDHGWEPEAEADPHDIAGLVAATVRALTQ
ncbi:MAG TPA: uroporphyrinogen-III synthase, partial [Acidobacteriaceae bacterium]|nr:uroporphyrinogen-III synthase [Acidobacteriaceae bacterium]